jgi:nucleoside-diphosphate-sugar epimerase
MLEHLETDPHLPKRVVVIGAGGFVGSAICERLEQRGIPYLRVTRNEVDLMGDDAAARLAAMLDDSDSVVAVAAIAPCKNLSMLQENLKLIDCLCTALSNAPVSHILNISSDAVYADLPLPLTEESCAGPGSLHGIMHLSRELLLREAAGVVPFATLRPTLIYGLRDPHNGYGPNRFRRLAAKGEKIVLFGEGEERRDHVLVDDVAELAVRMLEHRSRGILNAASGSVVSFRDVAEMVSGHFGKRVEIEGSLRIGPMPHEGYRPFGTKGTRTAFPDFEYIPPDRGFALVHRQMEELGDG